ncbi:MAG: hypothetical protein K6V97_03010 [Actinomycetia bacterium]|nr:hypothetical protein [Actinomycetes bacterium]
MTTGCAPDGERLGTAWGHYPPAVRRLVLARGFRSLGQGLMVVDFSLYLRALGWHAGQPEEIPVLTPRDGIPVGTGPRAGRPVGTEGGPGRGAKSPGLTPEPSATRRNSGRKGQGARKPSRELVNRGSLGLRQAVSVSLTRDTRSGLAAGLSTASMRLPASVGPLVAGWLMDSGNLALPFFLGAAVQLGYAVLYGRLFGHLDQDLSRLAAKT